MKQQIGKKCSQFTPERPKNERELSEMKILILEKTTLNISTKYTMDKIARPNISV